MLRTVTAGLVGLVVVAGLAWAADRELSGKIVKVDAEAKTVTVQTDAGRRDFLVGNATKILDAKGAASKDGLADKRLTAGAAVKLVLPETGRTLKELSLQVAAADEPTPKKSARKAAVKQASADKKEIKGPKATIVSVDIDKRTARVKMEDGKTTELKLSADVKFIGPRGGVSDKGIKDDRFVAGNEIQIVTDDGTKAVKEIHLPVRKSTKEKTDK